MGYKNAEQFSRILMAGMGRREDLEPAYTRVEMNPEDAEAVYLLGDVYLALGKYREAGDVWNAECGGLSAVEPLGGDEIRRVHANA